MGPRRLNFVMSCTVTFLVDESSRCKKASFCGQVMSISSLGCLLKLLSHMKVDRTQEILVFTENP